MKRQFLFTVFFWILGTFMFALSAQAIPMASLNVLDDHIAVGESFDVEVWADGDGVNDELLMFEFNVSTIGVFSYDAYMIGPGFDDFSDPFNPNNVTGSAFPGILDDDVLLATLTFTALEAGTGSIAISDDEAFFSGFAGLTYFTDSFDIDSSIEIGTSVPEPSTIILLGTALVGFIGMRRKFRVQ